MLVSAVHRALTRKTGWLGLCTVTFALVGCGSKEPPVYEVRGQVLFNGRPVPHAFVVLHPLDESRRLASRPRATTDENGNFVLSSFRADDGAPAGEYNATVEWRKNIAAKGEDPELSGNLLPAKYSKPATSGLRITVQRGNNEDQYLRLKG